MLDQPSRQSLNPARLGPGSFRGRILGLVLSLVVVLGSLGALAVWHAQESARDQLALHLLGTARAMARSVDLEFARLEAQLDGLALMADVRQGALPLNAPDRQDLAETLALPALAIAAPDGLLVASTAAPPARIAAGLPAAPEAMRVFTSGRRAISDFTEGNDPGRRIILAVPVREPPGHGAIRYALGAVMPRERLRNILSGQSLPAGWVASILDRQQTIVARTRAEAEALGRPNPDAVRQAMGGAGEGVLEGLTNLEGAPVVLAFADAPVSGYRVAIGAARASFASVGRDGFGVLAALTLPVALGATLIALLMLRGLSRALRRLAEPGTAAPGLKEVDELATALAAERLARDMAEEALRERSAWLEAAQQAADVGVFEWDTGADHARWSEGLAALLGLTGQDHATRALRHFRAAVARADRAALDAALAGLAAAEAGEFALEFRFRRGPGPPIWLRAQARLLPAGGGAPRRVLGAFMDITTRRALEAEREALLKHQEFLASEIHHRVKNSLQLVLSLLLMHARRASPEAAISLREAAGRVATVATVHRRLYEDSPEGAGDAARYLAGLVEELRASIGGMQDGREIRLVAEDGLRPGPERMAPIGMVATELLTNALKYGAGTITLRLRRSPAGFELAVEDAGPGFPEGFDLGTSRGLGMRVAQTLARQVGGQIEIDREAEGGRVVLRIPLD